MWQKKNEKEAFKKVRFLNFVEMPVNILAVAGK